MVLVIHGGRVMGFWWGAWCTATKGSGVVVWGGGEILIKTYPGTNRPPPPLPLTSSSLHPTLRHPPPRPAPPLPPPPSASPFSALTPRLSGAQPVALMPGIPRPISLSPCCAARFSIPPSNDARALVRGAAYCRFHEMIPPWIPRRRAPRS